MKKIPIVNQIIKNTRKEFGYTQLDFAKLINKGIATIRRYESGDIIPHNTLILICDKLNISFKEIMKKQFQENQENNFDYYHEVLKSQDNWEEIDKVISIVNNMDKTDLLIAEMYNLFHQYSIALNLFESNKIIQNKNSIFYADKENGKIIIKEKKIDENTEIEQTIDIFNNESIVELFKLVREIFFLKLDYLRKNKSLN